MAEARHWLGTPYQHGQSVCGVGCDCLGLVRGVWRGLYGPEPWKLDPYTGDWAECGGEERLKTACDCWLRPVALTAAQAGDVLIFRMRDTAVAKHAAILSAGPIEDPRAQLIHAYWGHAVTETWLGRWWRRHLIAAYAYPDAAHLTPPSSRPGGLESTSSIIRAGAFRRDLSWHK